jgi:hypothetical protein
MLEVATRRHALCTETGLTVAAAVIDPFDMWFDMARGGSETSRRFPRR